MKRLQEFNVVLIISDEHRRDVMGCSGNDKVITPHLDRIAERGIRFTNGYCASPLCAPSRASLLTGKYPCNHKALNHKMADREPGHHNEPGVRGQKTIADVLREEGYITGAIGKMHVHGERRSDDLGFDERALRFYTYKLEDYVEAAGQEVVDAYLGDVYTDPHYAYNSSNTPSTLEENEMFDTLVAEKAAEFIHRHKEGRFFLHVGFEKPHAPWKAPEKYHDMYKPDDMVLPENLRESYSGKDHLPEWIKLTSEFSDEEVKNSIAAYYANVTALDNNIGTVISQLEVDGLLENTIIIYTSDHGENLHAHGLVEKHCFYEGAVGVPFIISAPGLLEKNKVTDLDVSIVDLYPTIQALIGKVPDTDIDGMSITNALLSDDAHSRAIFSEFHEHDHQRMVVKGRYKYIHSVNGVPQLFDRKGDPEENSNLALKAEYASICEELKNEVLNEWTY